MVTRYEVQWRPVLGYEGKYEVSSDGQVRSLGRKDTMGRKWYGCVLKQRSDHDGYMQVNLHFDGVQTTHKVHRLVLEAFVEPCPEGKQACHGDGNPSNNHLSNLRWDDRKENWQDKRRHGRTYSGIAHVNAKLNETDLCEIQIRHRFGHSMSFIGRDLNVSHKTVSRVLSGVSYSTGGAV